MTVDRAPINLRHGVHPSPQHLAEAIRIVDASGLVEALEPIFIRSTGRPRALGGLRGLLVAFAANGLRRHHMGHLVEVARLIEALTEGERQELGITGWKGRCSYLPLTRWFSRLAHILMSAPTVLVHGEPTTLDLDTFMNLIVVASVHPDAPLATAVVVDETAVETWATMSIDPDSIELPNPRSGEGRPAHMHSKKTPARKMKVLARDEEGRAIYTVDPTARPGHRTGTSKRKSGGYIGHGLHIASQVSGMTSTNGIDQISFEPQVPNLIRGCALRSAGTHPGAAVLPMLRRLRDQHPEVREVIVDAGYSLKRENFLRPARAMGYRLVFELQQDQRGELPVSCEGRLIDGNLFSEHLPADLAGYDDAGNPLPLPLYPRNASKSERAPFTDKFDARARWRYSVHQGPDSDGYRRLKCPFCSRRLRSRAFPATMRSNSQVPLRHVVTDSKQCCGGESLLTGTEGIFWQDPPFGTSAWAASYGRKSTVESVNSAIKGQFTNIENGHVQMLGITKLGMMLAFSLAGCNYQRYESHLDKQEAARERAARKAKTRSPRRKHTLAATTNGTDGGLT